MMKQALQSSLGNNAQSVNLRPRDCEILANGPSELSWKNLIIHSPPSFVFEPVMSLS